MAEDKTPRNLGSQEFTVSTRTLIAILLTTFAWQLEVLVVVVHLFKERPLQTVPHFVLLALAVALTGACFVWAKEEARNCPPKLSRLVLKHGQPMIVILGVVSFGAVLGVITMLLVRP
jgi:hypothetical protein